MTLHRHPPATTPRPCAPRPVSTRAQQAAKPMGGSGDTAADPPFHRWLQTQVDPLLRWCLQQHAEAEDRAAFADQAVAVLRQDGGAELSQWLLWAAILLARCGAERGNRPEAAAGLSAEVRHLLHLAVHGRISSQAVVHLLQLPLSQARQVLIETTIATARSH